MVQNRRKRFAAAAVSAVMLACTVSGPAPLSAAAEGSVNYGEALKMSLYFYDSNACGSGVTGGPLTWRGDCHTYDGQASAEGLDGAAKAVVDPDGDGKVDLDGGYHDAGDHVKFNLTIGFSMSALALSEYLNPGVYQKAGARGHLEYVLRRGADFMMKSTFLDSSGTVAAVAGTIADGNVDHGDFLPPEKQTYQRDVFWLTAGKNNSAVCCAMAAGIAGTAYITKDTDAAYSAKCVKYAKALLDFGTTNVGNNTDGMSFYSTDSMYQDEESIARAWLYVLGEGDKPTRTPNNGDYGGIGDWDKFTWDKEWQGYCALMYKATKEEVFFNELKYEHEKNGLKSTAFKADAGWGNSRYNCALQMTALALADGDGDSEYAKAAKYQMDYLLDNHSTTYNSYLIGYGSSWPTHIHHRAAQHLSEGQSLANNPEVKYTNYGTLVGGPNGANGTDYEDHSDKYQYTEPALDYNACFALACAGLYHIYGGDASAWDSIAAGASEINADFDFGSSEPVQQTDEPVQNTDAPPVASTLRGDVDCSGQLEISDAILLAQFNAELVKLSSQGLANAHMNDDDLVDGDDLIQLLILLASS